MSGLIGLRYEVLFSLLDRHYSGEELDNAFSDIRMMEAEVLSLSNEKD